LACAIEMDKLRRPIGTQDQYAAAFGGLNWMTFSAGGIEVRPINVGADTLERLESNLLLMFTGLTRDSASILSRQGNASRDGDAVVVEALQTTRELAAKGRDHLVHGEMDSFGRLLDEAWQQKKRFDSGISNEMIDRWYSLARSNGALGGKIAGAGGGGFLMLYCRDGSSERVARVLEGAGLRRMDYCFESDGARVLFNAGLRLKDHSTQNSLGIASHNDENIRKHA
jgi:D-glycero-alpha-D-manno-heptose-7-phosphate kinase